MKKQSESLKSFNLPFISGVEVISGINITNEFRRHIHKTFIIGLVTQGNRIINHPGGTDQISMNEIFIINPNQVHSCGSESLGHSYKILSVSSQTMQSIASEISEKQENLPYFKNFTMKMMFYVTK